MANWSKVDLLFTATALVLFSGEGRTLRLQPAEASA